MTAVNVTQANLNSVGGPKDGWIQDGLIYEIDIKTNKVLFRWSAYEHPEVVRISDSQAQIDDLGRNKTNPYGYSHLNSIAKYGDSYLLSSRFLCSVWLIAPNGSALWNLDVISDQSLCVDSRC